MLESSPSWLSHIPLSLIPIFSFIKEESGDDEDGEEEQE